MTINYQFGDVDAHGAMIRAQAVALEAEHQSIIRDVLAAGDFWGGAGSTACQQFITELGRNFQVIYEQANAHGAKVQTAGSNMADTDSAAARAGRERTPRANGSERRRPAETPKSTYLVLSCAIDKLRYNQDHFRCNGGCLGPAIEALIQVSKADATGTGAVVLQINFY